MFGKTNERLNYLPNFFFSPDRNECSSISSHMLMATMEQIPLITFVVCFCPDLLSFSLLAIVWYTERASLDDSRSDICFFLSSFPPSPFLFSFKPASAHIPMDPERMDLRHITGMFTFITESIYPQWQDAMSHIREEIKKDGTMQMERGTWNMEQTDGTLAKATNWSGIYRSVKICTGYVHTSESLCSTLGGTIPPWFFWNRVERNWNGSSRDKMSNGSVPITFQGGTPFLEPFFPLCSIPDSAPGTRDGSTLK